MAYGSAASSTAKNLSRASQDAFGWSASKADDFAQTFVDEAGENAADRLIPDINRWGRDLVNQPAIVTREAGQAADNTSSNLARGAMGTAAVGGGTIGGGYWLGQRESRKETESVSDTVDDRVQLVQDIIEDGNLSEEEKQAALDALRDVGSFPDGFGNDGDGGGPLGFSLSNLVGGEGIGSTIVGLIVLYIVARIVMAYLDDGGGR